jgi:hypothetical protein
LAARTRAEDKVTPRKLAASAVTAATLAVELPSPPRAPSQSNPESAPDPVTVTLSPRAIQAGASSSSSAQSATTPQDEDSDAEDSDEQSERGLHDESGAVSDHSDVESIHSQPSQHSVERRDEAEREAKAKFRFALPATDIVILAEVLRVHFPLCMVACLTVLTASRASTQLSSVSPTETSRRAMGHSPCQFPQGPSASGQLCDAEMLQSPCV